MVHGRPLRRLKATLARGSRCELRLLTEAKRARVTIKDARGGGKAMVIDVPLR